MALTMNFNLDPEDNKTLVDVQLTPKMIWLMKRLIVEHQASAVNPAIWPQSYRNTLVDAFVALDEAECSHMNTEYFAALVHEVANDE